MLRHSDIGNPVVIDMKNVGIRYDLGPEVLSDINLSLRKGSFHFLTGKSGAGKTSLLSMMYYLSLSVMYSHSQAMLRIVMLKHFLDYHLTMAR